MKVLYGLYRPEEGEILIDGRPVSFHSPTDAIPQGIGMVHQHFMLVPTFTVAENIAAGDAPSRKLVLDLDRVPGASASWRGATGCRWTPPPGLGSCRSASSSGWRS